VLPFEKILFTLIPQPLDKCFARVFELDSSDRNAICQLVELSAELEDIEAVERWCDVMAQMPHGRKVSVGFRSRALLKCNRYDRARDLVMIVTQRYPDDPNIWVACGDVFIDASGLSYSNVPSMRSIPKGGATPEEKK
jgi:hypothetical protein